MDTVIIKKKEEQETCTILEIAITTVVNHQFGFPLSLSFWHIQ